MNELDRDTELLLLIALGDQLVIRQLVARKLSKLLVLGVRMLNDRTEAEDVAQKTFLRLRKYAENWQNNVKSGGAKFDTWMHKVALNLYQDLLNTRKDYVKKYCDKDAPELRDPALTPEQRLAKSQHNNVVTTALALLPNR